VCADKYRSHRRWGETKTTETSVMGVDDGDDVVVGEYCAVLRILFLGGTWISLLDARPCRAGGKYRSIVQEDGVVGWMIKTEKRVNVQLAPLSSSSLSMTDCTRRHVRSPAKKTF